eukprot:7630866-Pyramimonas_sp.AAC.1
MQAATQAAEGARRAARHGNVRRMQLIVNNNTQRGHVQTARSTPRCRDGPPPSPREASEPTLQRQGQTPRAR